MSGAVYTDDIIVPNDKNQRRECENCHIAFYSLILTEFGSICYGCKFIVEHRNKK